MRENSETGKQLLSNFITSLENDSVTTTENIFYSSTSFKMFTHLSPLKCSDFIPLKLNIFCIEINLFLHFAVFFFFTILYKMRILSENIVAKILLQCSKVFFDCR